MILRTMSQRACAPRRSVLKHEQEASRNGTFSLIAAAVPRSSTVVRLEGRSWRPWPMGSDHHRIHDSEHWQLEGSAPELYQRYLVPAVTGQWAADLVERAALQPGERVLDVACGTGVVARLAAARVGPSGRVAALDLNPGMLAVARTLPGEPGEGAAAVIEWYEDSALALPFPEASFEVAFCQLGLQFFPDRPQALQEMRRVLVSGGRLALSVFGPIEHNPATF